MITILLFLSSFSLYLHTCAPHLAPYRDAGEMAALLGTLGVAHPPGYPLYTLLGRCVLWIPLGNIVYRANFFSALCAAGALTVLFLVFRSWTGKWPAFFAVVFFAFSNPFWELANVSEMYALGVLWFALLLYATFVLKNTTLFAFLMALGLGVRMDMLLLVPLFILWIAWGKSAQGVTLPILFFALGATIFFYLMIRSRTNPLIDWGNPDTLLAVFNSATRKSYSGTLDLLSLSYEKGANFPINLQLYGAHSVISFGWWGVMLALVGLWGAFKQSRSLGFFLSAILLVTGPLFLFLANMPPNPHALAIVEASYLIPDVMVAAFIGFGVSLLLQTKLRLLATASVVILLGLNSAAGYVRASKRENFYVRDYVENVLRSVPPHAVAVFQKDVQLFSLWEAQLLEGRRRDMSLVSKGLSGSPWYWEMQRRWKTAQGPEVSLKEQGGWARLKTESGLRPLVMGYDVEWNDSSGLRMNPQGLVLSLEDHDQSTVKPAPFQLSKFCVYRGRYVYGETPDFFSTDLIGDLSRAHHQQGFYEMIHGRPEEAEWFFKRSEFLDPTFLRPTSDRAYMRFLKGDFSGAYDLYHFAGRKAEKTIELSRQYKSLPAVVDGCRSDLSMIYTQVGAVAERLGRLDEARNSYISALNIQENAQAHYNLAVTYWGRDWEQVIRHMRRAVQLNPQMAEARNYLAKAEMLVGKK